MASSKRETKILNLPIQALVDRIRTINSAGLRMKLKTENLIPGGMQFELSHGINMLSWGEDITITLVDIGTSGTNVDVFSCCILPAQIIDWGKNKQNVKKIFAFLSEAKAFTTPSKTPYYPPQTPYYPPQTPCYPPQMPYYPPQTPNYPPDTTPPASPVPNQPTTTNSPLPNINDPGKNNKF